MFSKDKKFNVSPAERELFSKILESCQAAERRLIEKKPLLDISTTCNGSLETGFHITEENLKELKPVLTLLKGRRQPNKSAGERVWLNPNVVYDPASWESKNEPLKKDE